MSEIREAIRETAVAIIKLPPENRTVKQALQNHLVALQEIEVKYLKEKMDASIYRGLPAAIDKGQAQTRISRD